MIKISQAEVLDQLLNKGGVYAELIERDGFDLGIYKPVKVDQQQPHLRDEVYIVATGTGTFTCENATETFQPGDAFYVPAKAVHRFENFSTDFSVWVIFFGVEQ